MAHKKSLIGKTIKSQRQILKTSLKRPFHISSNNCNNPIISTFLAFILSQVVCQIMLQGKIIFYSKFSAKIPIISIKPYLRCHILASSFPSLWHSSRSIGNCFSLASFLDSRLNPAMLYLL